MQEFDLLTPGSLEEAVGLLRQYGADAKLVAAGNSLLILLKNELISPRYLISLNGIPGLDLVREDTAGGLSLGALVTHRTIETSPLIREKVPILSAMAAQIASVSIRSRATIGGNLCQAHPQSDPPALMVALGARVRLVGSNGGRELAAEELFKDYYETVLEPQEILTAITIPPLPPRTGCAYLRLTTRSYADLPCVTAAVKLTLDASLERCQEIAIALGAVSPTPLRARAAEEALRGRPLGETELKEAATRAAQVTQPLSDLYGSAWYKREVSQVLVVRAIREAAARLRRGLAA